MSAADFLGYLRAMFKKEEHELREKLKISGHTGWQIRNTLAAMMGGKPVDYMDYLEPLGLLSEEEKQFIRVVKEIEAKKRKAAAEKEAEKNIQTAEEILAIYRGKKEGA